MSNWVKDAQITKLTLENAIIVAEKRNLKERMMQIASNVHKVNRQLSEIEGCPSHYGLDEMRCNTDCEMCWYLAIIGTEDV